MLWRPEVRVEEQYIEARSLHVADEKVSVPCEVLAVGGALLNIDVELFLRLRPLLPPATKTFIIGNAWGFSTLLLASMFGPVDALDAEAGNCSFFGTAITRKLVEEKGLDVQLTVGASPAAVPDALRFPRYDLAFIDGLHTDDQVLADFEAVLPFLSPSCVVVLHDVVAFGMQQGVAEILDRYRDFQYVHFASLRFQNRHGVGIAYRIDE